MAGKTIQATVAPGRHIAHGAVDKDGKAVGGEKLFRPGETIDLPQEEVTRLRELGYLVDPSGALPLAETAGPVTLREP